MKKGWVWLIALALLCVAGCAGAGNDNYCVDVYVRNRLAERLRVRSV